MQNRSIMITHLLKICIYEYVHMKSLGGNGGHAENMHCIIVG